MYLNPERTATGIKAVPELGSLDHYRAVIGKLKDSLVEQAGRLEFMAADARLRLAEIQKEQAEVGALAAEVKKTEIELDIFVLNNK
jgi:hypothetical protein